MCPRCMMQLSLEQDYDWRNNQRMLFWREHTVLQRMGAFAQYRRKSIVAHIIHHLKYYHHYELGPWMGRWAATTLQPTGLFEGVDALVPIPLTTKRLHWRGYNQAEQLARGLSEVLGVEVRTDILRRVANRESQARLPLEYRRKNVRHIFSLNPDAHPEGLHLMLVDDVMTTGATMMAAIKELEQVPDIQISVFVWSWTHPSADTIANDGMDNEAEAS